MSRISDIRQAGTITRAYAIHVPTGDSDALHKVLQARRLGFDHILIMAGKPADPAGESHSDERLRALSLRAHEHGLRCTAALSFGSVDSIHPLAATIASCAFSLGNVRPGPIADPRMPFERLPGTLRLRRADDLAIQKFWQRSLARWYSLGVENCAALDPHGAVLTLIAAIAAAGPRVDIYRTRADLLHGSEKLFLAERVDAQRSALCAHLMAITVSGNGWAIHEHALDSGDDSIKSANAIIGQPGKTKILRTWTAVDAPVTITTGTTDNGALVLIKNASQAAISWPPPYLPPLPWQDFAALPGLADEELMLEPGGSMLLTARALPAVAARPGPKAEAAAIPAARIVISDMAPSVDRGVYAVKRIVSERIDVTANIFADGHEYLSALVQIRAEDETGWQSTRMSPLPNDAWSASVCCKRLGRYEMRIEAWVDVWGGFSRDFAKKNESGIDLSLELQEAKAIIDAAHLRAASGAREVLAATLRALEGADQSAAVTSLLSATTAEAMYESQERRFVTHSFTQPIEVEREAARFSSWYELFPRSQAKEPSQHGTLLDVIRRLPHIASMGFDTVYFPPIHPIGTKNRKGANNTLEAKDGDVGSPYAIGSSFGGHDAIHPQLGTLDDFRLLIAAANHNGLEIALDFAIQCAPDHPWLAQHPGWFAWRPDGSIKYAENPPKKYQDIVNVDFYADASIPALWEALRDIVMFWIAQGVFVFRVDNPHTKPLPFWQWLIREVRHRDPRAIFLSEAFTRPNPKYHLAKVGFSQSYTYFTWRNEKSELQSYMEELAYGTAAAYFRPHFFVNTPDINPLFLQTSGRSGFLIRAALAATLSGLWGVYAGFEICESGSLPGKEEYNDSEKYQIRQRPDRSPGDIVDEISALNEVRRREPALQTHLNVAFHNAFNEKILYFSKSDPDSESLILVAVSLDPHFTQDANIEVPLWLLAIPDSGTVNVEDLITRTYFRWTGKIQHLSIRPELPYRLWRIRPSREGQ